MLTGIHDLCTHTHTHTHTHRHRQLTFTQRGVLDQAYPCLDHALEAPPPRRNVYDVALSSRKLYFKPQQLRLCGSHHLDVSLCCGCQARGANIALSLSQRLHSQEISHYLISLPRRTLLKFIEAFVSRQKSVKSL